MGDFLIFAFVLTLGVSLCLVLREDQLLAKYRKKKTRPRQ